MFISLHQCCEGLLVCERVRVGFFSRVFVCYIARAWPVFFRVVGVGRVWSPDGARSLAGSRPLLRHFCTSYRPLIQNETYFGLVIWGTRVIVLVWCLLVSNQVMTRFIGMHRCGGVGLCRSFASIAEVCRSVGGNSFDRFPAKLRCLCAVER